MTLPALRQMAKDGRRIAVPTAYDACLAAAADRAGVDVLLVGDSLGMVVQGNASTLSVSLDDVPYPTRCVAAARTRALVVPVIGIGAGPACSGQVLVIYDALGVTPGHPARFVRNFMTGHDSIEGAIGASVAAVKDGSFPAPEHCF